MPNNLNPSIPEISVKHHESDLISKKMLQICYSLNRKMYRLYKKKSCYHQLEMEKEGSFHPEAYHPFLPPDH